MTFFNPVGAAYVQGTTVQQRQSTDKARQGRKSAELQKNSALTDDQLEHQVESPDTLAAIGDDQTHQEQQKPKEQGHEKQEETKEDDSPGLDLTA